MYRLRFILLICFAFCLLALYAQPSPLWFGHYGGSGDDEGQASCFDSQGNYYLAGTFKGSFTAGTYTLTSTSHPALFVIKFNPVGEVLWAIQNGTNQLNDKTVAVTGIKVDNLQQVYISGHFTGYIRFNGVNYNSAGYQDIFLCKYNSSGVYQWVSIAGGTATDKTLAMCLGTDQSPVLCGYFSSSLTLNGTQVSAVGSSDILLLKFAANGSLASYNHWGGSGDDQSIAITSMPDGSYLVAGYYYGSLTLGGTTLSAGGKEAYLMRIDSALNPVWALGSTGSADQESLAITASDSGIFWFGKYAGAVSFGASSLPNIGCSLFRVAISPAGVVNSAVSIGSCSSVNTSITSAWTNAQQCTYVVGSLFGTLTHSSGSITSTGLNDALLLMLDPAGNTLWAKHFGGSGFDTSTSVCSNGTGAILCTGYYSPGAVFDDQTPANSGLKDIFGYCFADELASTPAVPANLSLSRNGSSLRLSWDEVTTSTLGTPLGVAGYKVYYSSNPAENDFTELGSTANNYLDLSGIQLVPELRFFRVTAYLTP